MNLRVIHIDVFENGVMNEKVRNKGRQHKSIRRKKRKGKLYMINDMSEYVILSQLMDTLGNVNHAVSISGVWIYD